MCIFYTGSLNQFELGTFQVVNNHMWFTAVILDNTYLEERYSVSLFGLKDLGSPAEFRAD